MKIVQLYIYVFFILWFYSCQNDNRRSEFYSQNNQKELIDYVLEYPQDYVGFNKDVKIRVNINGDISGVEFNWEQISGNKLDIIGQNTEEISFKTPPIESFVSLKERPPGPILFNKYNAGIFEFKLTLTYKGEKVNRNFKVQCAPFNPGWTRIPTGFDLYLDAGRVSGPYHWYFKARPPIKNLEVEGENERILRLKSDQTSRFIIAEEFSGKEFGVHVGNWLGNEGCGRLECHPYEYAGWKLSRMTTIFQRGIEGKLNKRYEDKCLECHTVGFLPGIPQDGFDDIMTKLNWKIPSILRPGNFDSMPFLLSDRAGVGCEDCHGAGRFYTSYSSEVCAKCHNNPPDYIKVLQWNNSVMSKANLRQDITKLECSRCHTAQGFIDQIRGHKRENAIEQDVQLDYEPITCPVCHDPHNGLSEKLIRYRGPLAAQLPQVDWGNGGICLACHYGGIYPDSYVEQLLRPFLPRQKKNLNKSGFYKRVSHAPQVDIIRGMNGIMLLGPGSSDFLSPHLSTPKGCVTCHMTPMPADSDKILKLGGHSFAIFTEINGKRYENVEGCAFCHGKLESLNRVVHLDYDGNGKKEGIFDEYESLEKLLKQAIESEILKRNYEVKGKKAVSFKEYNFNIVLIDNDGNLLGDEQNYLKLNQQDDLFKVTYNYLMVKKDRSKGVHNPVYVIRLLQRSIKQINESLVKNWDWR